MKVPKLKTQYFDTKLPRQKPMLSQIEWGIQNKPISQRTEFCQGPLYFVLKIVFQWTSYKEMIWFTNYPNVHIHTSRKRWSFIWGCFFPVIILNIFSEHMKIKIDFTTWRIMLTCNRNQNAPKQIFAIFYAKS